MMDDTPIADFYFRLLAGWCGLSLLVFGLMLTHESEPATYFGRYSASYLAALALIATAIIISGSGAYLARIQRLPKIPLPETQWFGWTVVVGGVALLIAAWLFQSSSRHLPAIALFRVYIAVVIIGGMLVLLYATKTANISLVKQSPPLLIIGLIAVAAVLTILYLGKTPPSLYFDEPGITNWARAVYRTGAIAPYLFPGRDAQAAALSTWGILPVFGLWLELTGVTFASARLFWLIVGWLAAPFIYRTAQRLYGSLAAIVALAIALILPLAHDYIRGDMFVGTALTIALYSYVRGRDSEKWYWHVITGAAAALAVEGHQYGARFVFVFGAIYLFDYIHLIRQGQRWDQRFWAFSAGALAYFAIYVLVHVVIWGRGNPLALPAILSDYYATEAGLSGSASLLERLLGETTLWFVNYLVLHPVEFVLFAFGIGAACLRRDDSDRLLLKLFLPSLLLFFILQSHYNPYYWIHNLPFVAILGGGLIRHITPRTAEARGIQLAGVSALVAIVVSMGVNIHLTAAQGQRFGRLIEIGYEIAAVLPDHVERVSGWQVYYYGLADRTYVNTEAFLNHPADTWADNLHVLPPQALILTRGLDDSFRNIDAFLESSGMQMAYCFAADVFGGRTILYLPTADLPAGAPIGCD